MTNDDGTPDNASLDPLETEIQKLEHDATGKVKAKLDADEELARKSIRITILKGLRKDLAATLPAFEAAYDGLHREDKNIQDILADEEDRLGERLGTKGVQQAKDLAEARDTREDALETTVQKAQEHLEKAVKNRDRKSKAVERRTAEFNEWKGLTATVAARQAVIKKVLDEVAKAGKEGRYAVAYWLLERARRQWKADANDDRLVRPSKVEEQFREAAGRLADAEAELATADSAIVLAKNALVAATQERDLHRSSSEAALRLDLEKITQKAP